MKRQIIITYDDGATSRDSNKKRGLGRAIQNFVAKVSKLTSSAVSVNERPVEQPKEPEFVDISRYADDC